MPHTLESGAFESPDEDKKEAREKDGHIAEDIKKIRDYLDSLEKNNIYYPFDYREILNLSGLGNTQEGKNLINEKQGVLKQIIAAIDQEKELKYWIPNKSNNDIVSALEELTGKSTGAEGESIRH